MPRPPAPCPGSSTRTCAQQGSPPPVPGSTKKNSAVALSLSPHPNAQIVIRHQILSGFVEKFNDEMERSLAINAWGQREDGLASWRSVTGGLAHALTGFAPALSLCLLPLAVFPANPVNASINPASGAARDPTNFHLHHVGPRRRHRHGQFQAVTSPSGVIAVNTRYFQVSVSSPHAHATHHVQTGLRGQLHPMDGIGMPRERGRRPPRAIPRGNSPAFRHAAVPRTNPRIFSSSSPMPRRQQRQADQDAAGQPGLPGAELLSSLAVLH